MRRRSDRLTLSWTGGTGQTAGGKPTGPAISVETWCEPTDTAGVVRNAVGIDFEITSATRLRIPAIRSGSEPLTVETTRQILERGLTVTWRNETRPVKEITDPDGSRRWLLLELQ
ncbi:MAG: hypothetical protein F4Z82_02830 [Caldilineaceae bacterium SB0668_bin_21]|nr:hypothetical protein [Caldilineaceae bacterium SB0668_bin_21]MXX24370.1 hypothetical protein [Caldilineaceae bacterium SB0668_bin_21]